MIAVMKYRYVYIALIGLALIVFQFLLQPEWLRP